MTEPTGLDLVIVNWNAGLHLRRCMESLSRGIQHLPSNPRIVVIDNASSDDSLQWLSHSILPITLIRNQYNRGFAAACNQGAMAGDAEYILFLNPDVRVNEDSLLVPLNFMQQSENAHCGICGIQLLDSKGNVSPSCARFPTWQQLLTKSVGLDRLLPTKFPGHYLSESEHRRAGRVDQVSGAFFLVRRQLFEDLGGFDERFFVYFEELDFSLRARSEGYWSMFLVNACAVHHGNASSDQVLSTRLLYWWRSRVQYCCKHFDRRRAMSVLLVTLLIEPISRLTWAGIRRSGREVTATVSATVKLWAGLPNLIASVVAASGDHGGHPSSGLAE